MINPLRDLFSVYERDQAPTAKTKLRVGKAP